MPIKVADNLFQPIVSLNHFWINIIIPFYVLIMNHCVNDGVIANNLLAFHWLSKYEDAVENEGKSIKIGLGKR